VRIPDLELLLHLRRQSHQRLVDSGEQVHEL
jgi:hypothetical protein